MTDHQPSAQDDAVLQDVLYGFAAEMEEAGPSYALLLSWTTRYPVYASQLTELAAGEAVLRRSPPSRDVVSDERLLQAGLDAARGVLERARRERPAVAAPALAVPGLMIRARALGLSLREIADRTRLSVTLVSLLDRRLIQFASIPRDVVDALAGALQTQASSVAEYLQQSPSFSASTSYRSEIMPSMPPTQSFFDAVRQDPTLDEERRAALLRLSPPSSG